MKILFVHNALSTFVQTDLNIINSEHEVRELYFRSNRCNLTQSILQSISGAFWADVVISWFGAFHALFPFLAAGFFHRRRIIIASGYDVASLPEIDYGNMRPGFRRLVGLLVFQLSNKVLAVSQSTAHEARINARVHPDKLQVIYHGFLSGSESHEREIDFKNKSREVITVGYVNHSNLKRKGLLTFLEVARCLPDVPFTLIGPWDDQAIGYLRSIASTNINFSGYETETDLNTRMKRAKVYVQVSAHEAFGMSLAEAMLSGCVPVVSDRGALKEVVGDTGFLVPYGDIEATAKAILQALDTGPEDGQRARARILEHFPLEKRRNLLLQALRT